MPEPLAAFARARGWSDLVEAGRGLEFTVLRATTPAGEPVALKTPTGARFQSNANDPYVDTRAQLAWEYAVTEHLSRHGLPVARPLDLTLGEPDVLVSAYLPDDGSRADQAALGALLARLHRLPPPPRSPVATEGLPAADLLPRRIIRRWNALLALGVPLPPTPPLDRLAGPLAGRPDGSLLHPDVRGPNLRCVGGAIVGLLDWSNALVGDPALELARLAEFARYPENGLDVDAIRAGYGVEPDPDGAATDVYRLDAAVMLCVVFHAEAPDAGLGAQALSRVRELHDRLTSPTG